MGLQNMLSGGDDGIELNREFRRALNAMENGNANIFITGRAGTGKSTLLDYFRSVTRKNVVALAPTGVAALNIKGQTIHSFFHFKPDITPDTVKRAYNTSIYKALDTIIIDEISMVRADLLDCIDRFMRLSGRDAGLPFGGVQMVFIGDLYQLPPVVTRDEEEIFNGHYKSQYFFDSRAFGDISIEFIELKVHYRQKDARFIELLNAIRTNSASAQHIEEINSRFNPSFMPKYSEEYVTLTTTNRHSDVINSMQLSKIPRPQHEYTATIGGEFNRDALPADEKLIVKEGAQVMMLNNDKNHQWVNGTIGTIKAIESQQGESDVIVVRLIDGTYVSVEPHTWELFRMSYDNIAKKLVSGKKGSFVQYLLMLAWAVTIHKSQGKTFDRVVIDIGEGTFAHGQLYVALSRCTRLDGIVLKRKIDSRHILTDGRILTFLSRYNLSEQPL